jgi:hypothetical protein
MSQVIRNFGLDILRINSLTHYMEFVVPQILLLMTIYKCNITIFVFWDVMTGKILYTNVSDKLCPIVGIKVKPEFGRSCRFFRNVGENFKI